jgi:hypothetical protein
MYQPHTTRFDNFTITFRKRQGQKNSTGLLLSSSHYITLLDLSDISSSDFSQFEKLVGKKA